MEDIDENIQELLEKFYYEAEKTVKIVEELKEKAIDLSQKGKHILIPEIKQNVRRHARAKLGDLTARLISLNLDLEVDYVDRPDFEISYFTPDNETVHTLKFLSGDNPWNFWLVDNDVDIKSIQKNLLQKHQNGLLDPVKKPKAKQSVCFLDRNKVLRGIILQIKNENRVRLVECDSNMTKVVASDKLFRVEEEACRQNASALRCTIAEEPDSMELDLWKNSDLRDLFCNTLRDATLGVRIIKRLGGPSPIFVVDIELKNEDDESTASLREWILDRLLPELKKLGGNDTEAIYDYLSEETLSPYYRGIAEKVINNEAPHLVEEKNSKSQVKKAVEKQCGELNNLNYPSDKLSKKTVTGLNQAKIDNNSIQTVIINLENKVSSTSEERIISSSSLPDDSSTTSKECLERDRSPKIGAASDSRLNCQTEEFRPRSKKPYIPRLNQKQQNQINSPQYNQYYPTYGPTCPLPFVPQQVAHQVQPWSYSGLNQQLHQVNSWGLCQQVQQIPTWPPVQVSSFNPVNPERTKVENVNIKNEVNVMAPEFVPRNNPSQQPKESNQVELPKEPITLRKSATLIEENENLLVLISHVESPSEFYVHFVNKNNKYLDKLYDEMFTYYSTREKIDFDSWLEAKNKLGKFCACKWSEDNHWYRVEVLDWAVGGNLVKVWFVDHGNTECVPLSCLQPLTKSFEKLPICCQACHLARVHPVIKGQPWSDEAIAFFKSKVEVIDSKMYSVTVVLSGSKAVKPNSFSVLLYEGKAEDNSKSINDMLVEQGLAWSRIVQSETLTDSTSYQSVESLSDNLSNNLPTLDCDLPVRPPAMSTNLAKIAHTPEINLYAQVPLNGLESEDAFDRWDPRKEDFESVRNNPSLDTDDACVAVSGYSASDEARICKFYANRGFCYKSVCYKEHSMPNADGVTTDKEAVYTEAFSQLELPKPGEVVRLKITCVFSINLFYAQIEEKRGVAVDDEFKEEAETLTSLEQFMNNLENVSKMKRLIVSPSPGELVLAKFVNEEDGSGYWYRARVITTADDNPDDDNPEVMFVDYGSTCTVSERDLRKMEPRYLHLPFQAIECSLANVVILESESESLKHGTELLQDVLSGKVLTAKIYESVNEGNVQQMDLIMESTEIGDVGEFLVANGFAIKNDLNWYKATACDTPECYPG